MPTSTNAPDLGFMELLRSLGLNLLNAPAHLALQVPEIATGMLAENTGPVAGQMLAPIITQLWGGFMDSLTGTSDSDIRISDLMGAYTTRSLERRIASRKVRREYGQIPNAAIEAQSLAVADSLFRSVYGRDATDADRAGNLYRGMRSLLETQLRGSHDITRDLMAYAASNGFKLGGFELGATGQPSIFSQQLASDMAQHIGEMFYGKIADDGTRQRSITGSLSQQELSTILEEAVRKGVIDGNQSYSSQRGVIEQYVQKIAQGIDNIKGAFGGNLTAAQARQLVTNLYGFDVAGQSASTFAGVAQDLHRLTLMSGITQADLFGDEKAGVTGALQIINQMAQGTGLAQHEQARLGAMMAAMSKGQDSGYFGVDIRQLTGQRLIGDELSGVHQNMAIALFHWASSKNLDARNLTAKQLSDFRSEMRSVGVDLRNAESVARYVGVGNYNLYANLDAIRAIAASNAALMTSQQIADQARIRSQYGLTQLAEAGGVTAQDLQQILGTGDIYSMSLSDVQSRIHSSKLRQDQKNRLSASLQSRGDFLRSQNISWRGLSQDVGVLRDTALRLGMTAKGFDGLIQYLNATDADKTTMTGMIRAYFGTDFGAASEEDQRAARVLIQGFARQYGIQLSDPAYVRDMLESHRSRTPYPSRAGQHKVRRASSPPQDTIYRGVSYDNIIDNTDIFGRLLDNFQFQDEDSSETSSGEANNPSSTSPTTAQTNWDEVSTKIATKLGETLREPFNNIAIIASELKNRRGSDSAQS